MKPLVSIIIPVYNVENYITTCIFSVINQIYENIEIIIIDDCSQDDSLLKARQILATCGRPWDIITHKYNKGLSAARNTGVTHAAGEYIFFLDSDDYITDDCIEKLYNVIKKYNAQQAFGSYYWPSRENDRNLPYWNIKPDDLDGLTPFQAYLTEATYATAHNRLIHRQSYLQTGIQFIEGILHEDDPWSFELALRMPSICGIADKTYCYIERNSSIMGKSIYTEERIYGRMRGLFVFSSFYFDKKWNINKEFRQWYIYRYFTVLSTIFISDCLSKQKKNELFHYMFYSVYVPQEEMYSLNFFTRMIFFMNKVFNVYLSLKVTQFIYRKYRKLKSFWRDIFLYAK